MFVKAKCIKGSKKQANKATGDRFIQHPLSVSGWEVSEAQPGHVFQFLLFVLTHVLLAVKGWDGISELDFSLCPPTPAVVIWCSLGFSWHLFLKDPFCSCLSP